MTDASSRLAALSPEKRALLERLLLERRAAASAAIGARDPSRPAPLSSSQQRLWFLDQLAPGSPTYNAVVAMWVDGDLDVGLLRSAVRAAVERHAVLRTVIDSSGEEPVQRVLDDWDIPVTCATAPGGTARERREAALGLAADAARAPYDLARDVPLRVLLVDVGGARRLLAFLEHHIAFDAWSDENLFREISASYRAALSGRSAESPPLPVQYADFAAWQRRRLDAGDFDEHARYWRATLRDAPHALALPLDHPRPERQTFAGRHVPLDLDHGAALRRLRQELRATDYMVLVAAWVAVLHRWTGDGDIVLGTPMANRTRAELEPLIGFFANTVPLRVRVDGSASFRDLVGTVAAAVLGSFDHQDLPFEKIVEAADPVRDPRLNPLFQVNVRVQSGPPPALDLPGLRTEPVHVDMGFSRFDLAVEFHVQDDRIGGYLEYNTALFAESTAHLVLDRLDLLLGAALESPDRPLWELPQPAGRRTRRRAEGPTEGPR